MKTILHKLIQVSKVIVFCVSLVAMLVLTAFLSPTALAANPGDPLRLGEENSISGATTSLVGNSNPTLELVNRAPTTTSGGSPALSLVVNPKVPPLVVNDTAGKAINLNADKLDGRDSTMFADGTNGKANDSDKLDGRDSTTFADAINGKANDSDKLDGRDSTTFADAIDGKAKDADKLDGRDSTTFANGTNGKANSAFSADNADKLDGKDSLQFWSGKSYKMGVGNTGGLVGSGNVYGITASCDEGDTLLNLFGGTTSTQDNRDAIVRTLLIGSNAGEILVRKSQPTQLLFAEVICADFPPLH
jgi:hypothetical protein